MTGDPGRSGGLMPVRYNPRLALLGGDPRFADVDRKARSER